MISPEVLRRLPMFAELSPQAIQAVAMLTAQADVPAGTTVVEADAPADALYILQEGAADLFYVVRDERTGTVSAEHFISELNPGEPFGISAVLGGGTYRGRVRTRATSRMLRIDAAGLRALCELEMPLALALTRAVARAALERLQATEVQLAVQRT